MKLLWKDFLACPYCKHKLKLNNGFLICKRCGRKFSVENNVPVFSGNGAKKVFNEKRYAHEYRNKVIAETERLKLEKALNFISKNSENKINESLDLGCNPEMTKLISKFTNSRTVGLNIISEGMETGGEWVVCDVEIGLPFIDSFFDLVFCSELIEHTFNTDYFISEIHRIQPYSLAVSAKKSYGNPFLKWDRFCGHTKLFTYKSMKEFLKDNGFEIIKVFGEFIHNPYDNTFKKLLRSIVSKFPSLSEDVIYICRCKK